MRGQHGSRFMRVYVYFNLTRKIWSVKALEGERKGKVIAHMPCLELADCTVKVSEASRQRVIRRGERDVHAGIIGTLVGEPGAVPAGAASVTYNPFRGPTFTIRETGADFTGAARVAFLACDRYPRVVA